MKVFLCSANSFSALSGQILCSFVVPLLNPVFGFADNLSMAITSNVFTDVQKDYIYFFSFPLSGGSFI